MTKQTQSCPVCHKSVSRGTLKRHMRTHTGEKLHSCTKCDQGFTRSDYLMEHMRSHTGERPYQCTKCNQAFTTSSNLTVHKRTHTGERPHPCTKCNQTFTQSSHLTAHMRTHTDKRPYQCTKCNQTFTESGSLTVHVRRVHTGEKPYPCTKCNKAFTTSGDLKRHEEALHPTRPQHQPFENSVFATTETTVPIANSIKAMPQARRRRVLSDWQARPNDPFTQDELNQLHDRVLDTLDKLNLGLQSRPDMVSQPPYFQEELVLSWPVGLLLARQWQEESNIIIIKQEIICIKQEQGVEAQRKRGADDLDCIAVVEKRVKLEPDSEL